MKRGRWSWWRRGPSVKGLASSEQHFVAGARAERTVRVTAADVHQAAGGELLASLRCFETILTLTGQRRGVTTRSWHPVWPHCTSIMQNVLGLAELPTE